MLLNKLVFHTILKSLDGNVLVHGTARFSQTEFEIQKSWGEIEQLRDQLRGLSSEEAAVASNTVNVTDQMLADMNDFLHAALSEKRHEEALRLFISDDDEGSLFELLDAELAATLKPYEALRRRVHEVQHDAKSALQALSRHDLSVRVASATTGGAHATTTSDATGGGGGGDVVYYALDVRIGRNAARFTTHRRYREFVQLDQQLRQSHPEAAAGALAPLPPPTPALQALLRGGVGGRARLTTTELERRRRGLNEYMQRILASSVLRHAVELQIFLDVYLHAPRVVARELSRLAAAAEVDENILLTRIQELEQKLAAAK